MTKKLNTFEKLHKGKNEKAILDENRETNRGMKKTWKTEEIISPNKRVITTPAGTFFVIEENGRTIQLTKVSHLPMQEIMKAYFDFRS